MNSILFITHLWTLAAVVHAGGVLYSPQSSSSWSSSTGTTPPAFVIPSATTSTRRALPSLPSGKVLSNHCRETSSISSQFSSTKVHRHHRPDTQRFNNLIYATDDTVLLLREELKARLLKAADEFNAMDTMNAIESTPTTTTGTTNTRQEKDRGIFVIRLLNKIVRKISRRGSSSAVNTITESQQQQRGILSSDSFRQAKLEVGELGKKVIDIAEQLSLLNPTPIPTLGFKHYGGAPPSESKLGGKWKLRFTTAADASFPKSETRGVVTTSQDIDPAEGTLTNVVDFEKGKLKGFRVVVEGEPISENTMRLSFKKVKILRQSRFPRLFGEITIRLPSRLIRWLGSKRKEVEVHDEQNNIGPYLQLRYLDDNLRMHTTNTGNWFIQTRL